MIKNAMKGTIDKEHLLFENIRAVKEVSIDDRRSY